MVISIIRRIWRFLKRLYAWIPVIWRDEDWEYAYLYEIMRFKISRIRKTISKNKRHLHWERDAKNMRIAEELLKRMSFSDFWNDNYNSMKDERCNCSKNSPFLEEFLEPQPNGYYLWKWAPCSYCKWLMKNVYKQKEDADSAYLWELMKKQSNRWWD